MWVPGTGSRWLTAHADPGSFAVVGVSAGKAGKWPSPSGLRMHARVFADSIRGTLWMEKSFGRRRTSSPTNSKRASGSCRIRWSGSACSPAMMRAVHGLDLCPFLLLDIGPHGFCFFAAAAAVILQQMNSARQQALPRRPIFRFRAPTRPFCRSNPHLFRLGGH
jgi:hypothetical protein